MAVAGTLEYLISVNGSKLSSGLKNAESKVQGFGNKMSSWAVAKGQVLGNLMTRAGQATVDFVKGAVQESMNFDSAMAQVAATMGKSTSEVQDLAAFARQMGAETAFSATQAAEALNYMALAGYDSQTSMSMLPTVLNLAAAGAMDLGAASDMVTDAQSALGLSLSETSTMVDQMAKASSKSNTSVAQLGEAMLTIGATARNVKGGTQELTTVLGVLADNGIKGAEGGTHLRNAILSLQTPTKDGTAALKAMGMTYDDMYDSAGNMRALPEIFQQMSTAMEGMNQQQKDAIISGLFNKTDLAAVNALLGTTEERWTELSNAIGDSAGAADKMAKTQLDNLNGDMTILSSALSEAKIALTEGLTPALRNLAQRGTKFVTAVTNGFKKDGLNGALRAARIQTVAFVNTLAQSEMPIVSSLARVAQKFSSGLSWANLEAGIKQAWTEIKAGAESLGGIVFGRKKDGSVAWPTWDDVKVAAGKVWDKIKAGATMLAGLVFGKNEDGSVNWPTWDTVKAKAADVWETIKAGALEFAGFVFGKKEDGSVNWPTWDDVSAKASEAWEAIKAGALGFAGLVFGKKADGSVDWPTWDDVSAKATEVWESIKENAKNLAGLVFGKSENGEIAWPDVGSITEKFSSWWSDTAVPAMTGAMSWTLKLFGMPAESADSIATTVGEWWSTVVDTVTSVLNWALNLPDSPHEAGEKLREILSTWWEGVKSLAEGVLTWTLGLFGIGDSDGSQTQNLLSTWWDSFVKPALGGLLNFTLGLFGLPSTEEMVNAIKKWWEQVKAAVGSLFITIGTVFTGGNPTPTNPTGGDVVTNTVNTLNGGAPSYSMSDLMNAWNPFGNSKGAWEIPYDNYPALLHRGERVLTASQARQGDGMGLESTQAIVAALQGLRNDMQNIQLVVGDKAFGKATVRYGGERLDNYIGESESRLMTGYGW